MVRERDYNSYQSPETYVNGAGLKPEETKIFGAVLLESWAISVQNGADSDHYTTQGEANAQAKQWREAIKVIDSLPNDENPHDSSFRNATELQAKLDGMGGRGNGLTERLQFESLERKAAVAWEAFNAINAVDYEFDDTLNDKIKNPISVDTQYTVNKEIRFLNDLAKSNAEYHKDDIVEDEIKSSANESSVEDAREESEEYKSIVPEDGNERRKFTEAFFGSNMNESPLPRTPENIAVLRDVLVAETKGWARNAREGQKKHGPNMRYPGNVGGVMGNSIGVPEKGTLRFGFDIFRFGKNNPSINYNEFASMNFKQFAKNYLDLDITKAIPDYDNLYS
jgi:hypothetical protein